MMDGFEVLASPARRQILDLLAGGDRAAGELTAAVVAEHGLTQPAVSRHLAVLREAGVVAVRPDGARRIYALVPGALRESHAWLSRYESVWSQRLDALDTELARGARAAEVTATDVTATDVTATDVTGPRRREGRRAG